MHHYQQVEIKADGIITVLTVTERTEQGITFGIVRHGFLMIMETRDIIN